ncbi:MAG: hypothetical protein AAGC67_01995 [Myxococcota bacterium]
MKRRSSFFALTCAAFVSIAATCTGPRAIDLDIQDRGQQTPGARVAWEAYPGNETRRRGALLDVITGTAPLEGTPGDGEIPETTPTFSVVAEFAHTGGHGSEAVPIGREIEFDEVLPGPTVAGVDVENFRGFVAARPGLRLQDMFSAEVLLGAAIDRTRVRVQNASFLQTKEQVRSGAVFGLRLGFRPIPLFDVYGQASSTVGSFITTDLEVGGQLNLTRNLGAYAGFRRFKFEEEQIQGADSDAEYEFSGPTFGMSLTF